MKSDKHTDYENKTEKNISKIPKKLSRKNIKKTVTDFTETTAGKTIWLFIKMFKVFINMGHSGDYIIFTNNAIVKKSWLMSFISIIHLWSLMDLLKIPLKKSFVYSSLIYMYIIISFLLIPCPMGIKFIVLIRLFISRRYGIFLFYFKNKKINLFNFRKFSQG